MSTKGSSNRSIYIGGNYMGKDVLNELNVEENYMKKEFVLDGLG
jgi:hypothetical protein